MDGQKPADNEIISNDFDKSNFGEKAQNGKKPAIHDVTVLEERDADTEDENDYEVKENNEGLNGTTRTITLQTLMSANILQPGKSLMTIDYLGQKFVGDLMPDGKIKSQETETVFLTPSAWAMHCKRIINPEKKSGCGWASVKYKGKKLDAYKNSWLRKCAMQKGINMDDLETDIEKKADSLTPMIERAVCSFNTVANRSLPHDGNMLIKAITFSSMGKVQPFLVTFNTSALLLADFHCHLTIKEVCGYFGGHWDTNSHTLTIIKAYPCRATRIDSQKAAEEENRIRNLLLKDQLLLVGWYHSHPKFQAEPSLRDCDTQLDFQIRMRGPSDVTYTPCISTIISPYYDGNPTLESDVKSIWVTPPFENKQILEYGRPMLMEYSVILDKELTEYVRLELQACAEYYVLLRNESVKFNKYFNEELTFLEKLKTSLHSRFPSNVNPTILWNWICEVLDCDKENEYIPPKYINSIDGKDIAGDGSYLKTQYSSISVSDKIKETFGNSNNFKLDTNDGDKKPGGEIKVMSLQEQLCLPSGLNMNPVRTLAPLATPNVLAAGTISTLAPAAGNTVTSSQTAINPLVATKGSPDVASIPLTETTKSTANNLVGASNLQPVAEITLQDSPITVPSSSVSPPHSSTELPFQSPTSPPPSKSESLLLRPQNMQAQSPKKQNNGSTQQSKFNFTKNDGAIVAAANTPTPNATPPQPQASVFPAATTTTNDLVAASLAQLAGQLAPNFLQTDLSAIFQRNATDKNYTNAVGLEHFVHAEKSAAAAAAAAADLKNANANETVVSAYTKNFNSTRNMQESALQNHQGTLGNPKNKAAETSSRLSTPSPSTFPTNASNLYKTKLMKELDNIKNDPLKINELIRSPEYAALLLHQAEALGATTLGTLGLGSDFLTGLNFCSKDNPLQAPDYNNVMQASKVLGYESVMQQQQQQAAKSEEINSFIQQQMGAVAAAALVNAASLSSSLGGGGGGATGSSKRQQKQAEAQAQADYTSLLQTYSKLFESGINFREGAPNIGEGKASNNNTHHELESLLSTRIDNEQANVFDTTKSKTKEAANSRNQHQQQQRQNELHNQLQNSLFFQHCKSPSDLSALFAASSSAASNLAMTNKLINSNANSNVSTALADSAAALHYNGGFPSHGNTNNKPQTPDYSYFQQQYGKHDANFFMSPAAMLKLQKDSFSAMMMKPPKSSSASSASTAATSSSSRSREASISPAALGRLTPTKSGGGGGGVASPSTVTNSSANLKYNFSAIDLAVSSIQPITSISSDPADAGNNSTAAASLRRPSITPPVDLSSFYNERQSPSSLGSLKKRMEFSSIAELAAPPPAKFAKSNDDGHASM